MSLEDALSSLRKGEFVLVHDGTTRENEVDMVVAGESITPEHVARMRQHAGGLLCMAIENSFAQTLGLQYMHNILSTSKNFDDESKKMIFGLAPYGDRPTFSISINSIHTFTGITDMDRANTIRDLSNIYQLPVMQQKKEFVSSFKTPGHVPTLIAAKELLKKRTGHTEMSITLMNMANLSPITAICEMLDSDTYAAMTVEKAKKYAEKNGIPFLDGRKLLEVSQVH